jgi:hypothetical protein
MNADAVTLKVLIGRELTKFPDERIIHHIRAHLVEPAPELRDWDYGAPDQQYPCWIVFRHAASNTGIAFCEQGFGPRCPWGLLWIGGGGEQMSIGQDSGWYTSFLETYFNSFAVCELPIWRVFKKGENGQRTPISGEGPWDETWAQVMALRERYPDGDFNCASDVGVRYRFE